MAPKYCPKCRCAIRDSEAVQCPRCRASLIAQPKPPHETREPFALLPSVAFLLDFFAWLALAGSVLIAVNAFKQSNWTLMLYPALVFPQSLLLFAASGILRVCLDIRSKAL